MKPRDLNILLIAASMALYYLIISPLYSGGTSLLFAEGQDITTLTKTRDTYDKTIEEVPRLIALGQNLKKGYDSIQEEDRKKILTMVPVSVDDIKLLSEITNIGAESGVILEGMGIKDMGAGEYSVSFNVSTTYTNFKNIMTFWEKSMRLFTLQSVTFTPGKSEIDPIKFSVALSTYYMK